MKHYLIYYKEVGLSKECCIEYVGDVTKERLVDFFGLNEPDVASYRIEEVNHPNKIII